MALTSPGNVNSTLYFTYLTSTHLYSIQTEYLRMGKGGDGSIVSVGTKPYGKQMVLLGADGGNSLFFRYKGENDIYMWNTKTCFKISNLQEIQRGEDCRLTTQVRETTHEQTRRICIPLYKLILVQRLRDLCIQNYLNFMTLLLSHISI